MKAYNSLSNRGYALRITGENRERQLRLGIRRVYQCRATRRLRRLNGRVLTTDESFKELLNLPQSFSDMDLTRVLLAHPIRPGGSGHAGVNTEVCLASIPARFPFLALFAMSVFGSNTVLHRFLTFPTCSFEALQRSLISEVSRRAL
jgi:hypothetical protein